MKLMKVPAPRDSYVVVAKNGVPDTDTWDSEIEASEMPESLAESSTQDMVPEPG